MQGVSERYKELLAVPGTRNEVKAIIAGEEYGHDRIVSAETKSGVFSANGPGIGGAYEREIELVLRDAATIPRMAEIFLYLRLVRGETASEWLPKGVFYIDTRSEDYLTGALTIHGYDAMLKTEQSFTTPGEQGYWPRTDIAMVDEICARIGVSLDARTRAILTRGYLVQYPGIVLEDGTPQYDADGAYSMREVLGYIGSMYAGNWIMSDAGELRLVVLGDVPAETHSLVEEHGDAITLGGVRLLV